MATHAADPRAQDGARCMARADDPRGSQPSGPPDDGGRRVADPAAHSGFDRPVRARRTRAGPVARDQALIWMTMTSANSAPIVRIMIVSALRCQNVRS